ncbi:MAG: pyridoxamine 5'-phosphate oxidase family protein [Planctomycetota bacterium]
MAAPMTREAGLDPDVALDSAWSCFVRGLNDRRSPSHAPTLATVDPTGGPKLRTVVLRIADRDTRRLGCHTRADAGKVAEIRQQPQVSWHVYDRKAKLQIVFHGRAEVHTSGPLADARWEATSSSGRACYEAQQTPGTPWQEAEPSADGRSTFAVVTCACDTIDWLFLHHAGHVRWRFRYVGGVWQSTHVAP